jgi:hypothetical protein
MWSFPPFSWLSATASAARRHRRAVVGVTAVGAAVGGFYLYRKLSPLIK